MKLSTKGRYGTRLMLDLALHFGEGPVLLKDIAARQGISEKYLWQLVASLKNAGLVSSSRGSRGGYVLAKGPHEINLGQIVGLLEGAVCLVNCVDKPSLCRRSDTCVTRDIWQELSRNMLASLSEITLAEMADKQKNKVKAVNYSI